MGGGIRAVAINKFNSASTIANGQKAVTAAGTAEALGSGVIASVTVKAKNTNTGNIYLGNSSVDDTNGHILSAGENQSLEILNLSTAYIDADNSGEGVSYIGVAE